jgi:hypothetical protein
VEFHGFTPTNVIARFNRATQYSRDASDFTEKPRRTGSPACAGDDDQVWSGPPFSGTALQPERCIFTHHPSWLYEPFSRLSRQTMCFLLPIDRKTVPATMQR